MTMIIAVKLALIAVDSLWLSSPAPFRPPPMLTSFSLTASAVAMLLATAALVNTAILTLTLL